MQVMAVAVIHIAGGRKRAVGTGVRVTTTASGNLSHSVCVTEGSDILTFPALRYFEFTLQICGRDSVFSLATHRPHPPHVMALFKDGADSFLLSRGATLAELAEFIDELGSRHSGAPVAVNVQFDPPGLRIMAREPSRKAPSRVKLHPRTDQNG